MESPKIIESPKIKLSLEDSTNKTLSKTIAAPSFEEILVNDKEQIVLGLQELSDSENEIVKLGALKTLSVLAEDRAKVLRDARDKGVDDFVQFVSTRLSNADKRLELLEEKRAKGVVILES